MLTLVILDEAEQGDPEAAKERMQALEAFKLIEVTDKALEIAQSIMEIKSFIPEKAAADAAHIGMAAAHGIHFLLTWNCKHFFSDGAVIGSQESINEVFKVERWRFGPSRSSGARSIRKIDAPGLCSLRDLRVDVFG